MTKCDIAWWNLAQPDQRKAHTVPVAAISALMAKMPTSIAILYAFISLPKSFKLANRGPKTHVAKARNAPRNAMTFSNPGKTTAVTAIRRVNRILRSMLKMNRVRGERVEVSSAARSEMAELASGLSLAGAAWVVGEVGG